MQGDDVSGLTQLGSQRTIYLYTVPSPDILETFSNPNPHHPYTIELLFDEFTSLCPKTGQPDFASLVISYIPRSKCVETKSLKLYLFAYRQQGAFMERITNTIKEDLVLALEDPIWLMVRMNFNPRGGIALNCTAEHGQKKDKA